MSNHVFPIDIAGAQPNLSRTPMTSTEIKTAANGYELRASYESWPRYKYKLTIQVLRSDAVWQDFQTVSTAFSSVLGAYDSFLIEDPNDKVALATGFGVTDGVSTAYQLQRTLGGFRRQGYWDPNSYPILSTPRANLFLQSQAIDATAWTKTNVTIGTNVLNAPDGTITGDRMLETSGTSGVHAIQQLVISSGATGIPFTFSAFVQMALRPFAALVIADAGTPVVEAWFDIQSGAVALTSVAGAWTNVSATITAVNGWYRISVTATKGDSGNQILGTLYSATSIGSLTYAGNTSATALYAWGLQMEQAAQVTDYITTVASAVNVPPQYWPNSGDGFEPITEVNPGTLKVYLDGALQPLNSSYAYLGAGEINFVSVPASGKVLTWSGNYFRRVRFAGDQQDLQRIFGQLWEGKSIEFQSLK